MKRVLKKGMVSVCAILVLQCMCLCAFAPQASAKEYDENDDEYRSGYEYEISDDYLLKIVGEDADYTFYDFPVGVETAEELANFLFREQYYKEKIYNYLEEEGGETFESVIRQKEKIPFMHYTFRNDEESVSKLYSRDKIALNNSVDKHLAYWLMSIKKTEGEYWSHDAFVMYINMIYAENDYWGDIIGEFLETGHFTSAEENETDKAILNYAKTYMEDEAVSPNRAVADACAAVQLFEQLSVTEVMDRTYIEQYAIREAELRPGDELTRIQSTSFFAWLTDHYTLEKSLQLCKAEEPDFEKIFGDSYDTLKERWQESLRIN